MASSGTNDENLTYLKSHKLFTKNQDTTMDLSTITKEVGNMHEVIITDIAEINFPRAIFIPVHDLNPTELAGGEITPTETLP